MSLIIFLFSLKLSIVPQAGPELEVRNLSLFFALAFLLFLTFAFLARRYFHLSTISSVSGFITLFLISTSNIRGIPWGSLVVSFLIMVAPVVLLLALSKRAEKKGI